jgi:hypothetical protein
VKAAWIAGSSPAMTKQKSFGRKFRVKSEP